MNRSASNYAVSSVPYHAQASFRKSDVQRIKTFLRLVIFVMFVVALALFYIWTRIQSVQMGYLSNELRLEHMQLQEQSNNLKTEISWLSSPERLRQVATQTLHMDWPLPTQIVKISLPQQK